MLHRRGLLLGLASALAAPAIVRASSLMPVRAIPPEFADPVYEWTLGTNLMQVRCKIIVVSQEMEHYLLTCAKPQTEMNACNAA